MVVIVAPPRGWRASWWGEWRYSVDSGGRGCDDGDSTNGSKAMAYKGQQTYYEWTVEVENEDGDIVDSYFFDTLAEAVNFGSGALGLVRNVGSDSEGVEDRQWAYPVDDKLPDFFDGGAKVPSRFAEEWSRLA